MAGTIHKADGTILHLVDAEAEATTLIAAKKADAKTASQWADAVYTNTILPPAGAHHPDWHVKSGAVVRRKAVSDLVPLCEAGMVALRDYLERIRERGRMNLVWRDQSRLHAGIDKYYRAFYRISKREFVGSLNPAGQTVTMKTYWAAIPNGPGVTDEAFLRAVAANNFGNGLDGVVFADPRNGESIEPVNTRTVSQSLELKDEHSSSSVDTVSIPAGEWISGVV